VDLSNFHPSRHAISPFMQLWRGKFESNLKKRRRPIAKKWEKRKEQTDYNLWELWSDPCGARLAPGLKPLRLPRATYQKIVLLVVLDGMWERISHYMDTSNLIFTIVERSFITIEAWTLSTVGSAEYVSTGQINDGPTMDQRWINSGSTMDQWSIYDNIQCVTYTRIILLVA